MQVSCNCEDKAKQINPGLLQKANKLGATIVLLEKDNNFWN